MDKIDVLCIGQSTVDIFCNTLERVPREGEFCLVDQIALFPGGCPTNTALVTAKLGLKTCLMTAIGNDHLGKFLLDELEKVHIITDGITVLEWRSTGECVIVLVKNEDRRLIFQHGANREFGFEHISFTVVDRSNMDLLIDYQERNSMEAISGVIELTDYLIMNSDEGARLTGFKDYRMQSDHLLKKGAKNVVVKLGVQGSYLRNRESSSWPSPTLWKQRIQRLRVIHLMGVLSADD